ncbi:hypothetical protein VNI00_003321 [Paramarasmius palmivorus]|uniref:F-box domain-containing protein n=1 Tax=Paramarasmius palmivorus TaxID=297713 RepID=A0AAW0DSD2_9AGAR
MRLRRSTRETQSLLQASNSGPPQRRNDDMSYLFDNLTCPQLVSLEVTVWDTTRTNLEPLVDLLSRSQCPLNDLTLEIPYIHRWPPHFLEILECCPRISTIEVNTWEGEKGMETFTYALLVALCRVISDDSQNVGPNLKEVRINEEGSSANQELVSGLMDLLEIRSERRRIHGGSVGNFHFIFGEADFSLDATFDSRIRKMADEGVKCDIQWAKTLSYLEEELLELERCEEEIERVGEALAELLKQRRTLLNKIERRRSWMAPIRKLPVEVLEEIFAIHCLFESQYSLDVSPNTSRPNIAPTLNLAQVSHHWRHIVNSSPRLWSTIRIDVSVKVDMVSLLGHYLSNSKEYPLDLDFTALFSRENSRAKRNSLYAGMAIAKMLSRHFSRIENLNLTMKMDIFNHCTSLQSLDIRSLNVGEDSLIDVNIPSLRHLSVNAHGEDIPIFLGHLTLPQLDSLEITVWSGEELGGTSLEPLVDLLRRSECRLSNLSLDIPYIYTSNIELQVLFGLCSGISRLHVNTWQGKKGRDTFIYELLDALRTPSAASGESKGMLASHLAEMRVVEENSSVDQVTATALLDIIEARNGRRIDDGTSVWDLKLEFGQLWECPMSVLGRFNARMSGLADKGVRCTVEWAKGAFPEC